VRTGLADTPIHSLYPPEPPRTRDLACRRERTQDLVSG